MKNNGKLLIIKAFMLLFTLTFPLISLSSQEKTGRILKRRGPQYKLKQSQKEQESQQALQTAQTTTAPAQVEPPQNITKNSPSDDAITEPNVNNEQIAQSQQVKINTAAQTIPTNWYYALTPLLLATLYQGAEGGIAAFTKTMIKLFVKRRDSLNELEKAKKEQEKLISQLPTEQQSFYQAKLKKELEALQQPISIPSLLATGAYVGAINTVLPATGSLLNTALKIGLQMLMPKQ